MSVCKTNTDEFTPTVGLDVSDPADEILKRVEMRLNTRQISQKMGKLWSLSV